MDKYHKIPNVFLRDHDTPGNPVIYGAYSTPAIGYIAHLDWLWTEKIDGTNIRIQYAKDSGFSVAGRTDNAQIPPRLQAFLSTTFSDRCERISTIFADAQPVTFYGEGFGMNIQAAGPGYGPQPRFALFDIKVGQYFLPPADVSNIAMELNLERATIIGCGPLDHAIQRVKQGFKSSFGDLTAEGIIAIPTVPLYGGSGRVITKIKHRDFANADL